MQSLSQSLIGCTVLQENSFKVNLVNWGKETEPDLELCVTLQFAEVDSDVLLSQSGRSCLYHEKMKKKVKEKLSSAR